MLQKYIGYTPDPFFVTICSCRLTGQNIRGCPAFSILRKNQEAGCYEKQGLNIRVQ